jgi:hypothetical protein
MKKNNLFFFIFVLLVLGSLFLFSRDFFLSFASDAPYLAGFLKFFVLASLGDFLSSFLKFKTFTLPNYVFIRAIIWGIIGLFIVMMFPLYSAGVSELMNQGYLPFEGAFFQAFFISVLMNYTFGAMMMLGHFTSDGYLDHLHVTKDIGETMRKLDYVSFMRRTFFKVIPFFWIPAHTITFLLPSEYRVLFAATLGIALGFLLGFTKRMSTNGNN